MSKHLVPYRPNAQIDHITSDYEASRVAGIWNKRPLNRPLGDFPFLVLSQSRAHVPLRSMPLYRFDAGDTSTTSAFPFPKLEKPIHSTDPYERALARDDVNNTELAELALVKIARRRLSRRPKEVSILLHRSVNPLRFHPPLIDALDTFMETAKVNWDPHSLRETDINENFATYKAPVPQQQIMMELGGPPHIVDASAIVAAGMRMVVCETMAIQHILNLRDAQPDLFTPEQ